MRLAILVVLITLLGLWYHIGGPIFVMVDQQPGDDGCNLQGQQQDDDSGDNDPETPCAH